MIAADIVNMILPGESLTPEKVSGSVFAASNIALVKYWGKRNDALKLPNNSSLSISLGNKGAHTTIAVCEKTSDNYCFDGKNLEQESPHYKRLHDFFDLFRPRNIIFDVTIALNIPFAAGLASSACIFASIVLALNELFSWELSCQQLSILARLGSGSAARSISPGFVEWHCGNDEMGLDSYAESLDILWPELRVGLCIISSTPKKISSSVGMQQTCNTSPLYKSWPDTATHDLITLKKAIVEKNFPALGAVSEANALAMHATMMASRPAIIYSTPETLALMQRVWALRDDGVDVYFTQDAGPNLKLLFESKNESTIRQYFNDIDIIQPFEL